MIATASCAEGDVIAVVEDNLGFGEGSVVFDFGLSDGWAIIGENDQLGFSISEGL